MLSVCYRMWIWDDEANVLLAANYINALSSLNCLSLPAQPFPNTGALSCLSRGWLLRAWAGPAVGEGETHVTIEDEKTRTVQQLQPPSRRTVWDIMRVWGMFSSNASRLGLNGKFVKHFSLNHDCQIFGNKCVHTHSMAGLIMWMKINQAKRQL